MKNTPLENIMVRNPVTLNIDENFCRAAGLFKEKNIRHLPVVNSSGVIMGVVSQRDFNRITAPKKDPSGDYVYDMNELAGYFLKQHILDKVITLPPTATIEQALELMAEKKLGCIPVVDSGDHVVGIVTAIDMLKLFLKILRQP